MQISRFFILLPLALQSWTAVAAEPEYVVTATDGMRLEIFPGEIPIELNRMHSWRLKLLNADSSPADAAHIEISGGMPEHDHGLPTKPQITAEPEPGEYLLQGMRFHMPGSWQLIFTVRRGQMLESLTLEFSL